ncbi:MAG: malate/lactate/ureidoglycolate dehydrogenase [Pseudomonadales bacterium]
MNISPTALTSFVTQIFRACGATAAVAQEVSEHLVTANLKGHDSHGVGMIPTYVHNIGKGLLNTGAHAEVSTDRGAVLRVDGNAGFGQVVGREACDLAIARVRDTGVVALAVRNAHHLGRIGHYAEHCAAAGLVSVHFVNVVGHEPQVSPFGGRERRMTTNPFCVAIPRANADPVVLDMATSAIALGKVRVAHMKGEAVADGVLVDHQGVPTNDPGVMYEAPFGSLGPFGGHKGYGLAVICELLGGALAGEWTAQPGQQRPGTVVNHMLQFIIDPGAFGGLAAFDAEASAMIDYLNSTAPATGFDRVRVPGDPERETMSQRHSAGIPIDDNSWSGIVAAAERAGVDGADIPAGDAL